jgi:hypothetical protein
VSQHSVFHSITLIYVIYYILTEDERILGLSERRVLGCIFGAVQDKGTWRKRHNHELYRLFNESDITEYIKINRLSWAGHIICMENSRIVK